MKNLITRTIFGLMFAVVMIGAMVLGAPTLSAVLVLVTMIGSWEWIRMHQHFLTSTDKLWVLSTTLGFYVVLATVALEIFTAQYLALLIPLMLLPLLHALFSIRHKADSVMSLHWFSMLFVALPAALMLFFYRGDYVGNQAGYTLLLLVIAFIWINDIFAYLVGIMIGKHRLFERISPKKSWEGSIGGLVFTLITALLVSRITDFIPTTKALWMAGIVVVTGSLGDLIESMIKRQANVKDSGSVIPGHGGILDRFDAAFYAIPFVFVYLLMSR